MIKKEASGKRREDDKKYLVLLPSVGVYLVQTPSEAGLEPAIRCTPEPQSVLKDMQGRQYTGPKTPRLGMSSLKSPNATGTKP
ncbi:uncharacterized [Tachysurus ichikawai]